MVEAVKEKIDNMKILIIGSQGMLGSAVLRALPHAESLDKKDIDITKRNRVLQKISSFRPDIIINCAAYTQVDKAEKERELCYEVNCKGARHLAEAAKKVGAILIHISTDYVFDGNEKDGYNEDAKTNPINFYGRTKADGEKEITKILDTYYIIRTSWLFGKGGKNFVDTIKEKCLRDKNLAIVDDQKGSPTYTEDLASFIGEVCKNMNNYPFGIYHITNKGTCTWLTFAKEIKKMIKAKCAIKKITSAELQAPAKRPSHSILRNNKAKPLRSWKDALKAYLEE